MVDSASKLSPAERLASLVRRGPRYTSYPPATQFTDRFTADDAAAELARVAGEGSDRPISLYLHVPFCASLCWYCGCNVVITRKPDRVENYVATLVREIEMLSRSLGAGRALTELAIGGGSPNSLSAESARRIMADIRERFTVADDAELAVELDPRLTTPEKIALFADLGFTRVSVGVQDFDPVVQKAIHRDQTIEQTSNLIRGAREVGLKRANVDLVYGLPAQKPETFQRTLDAVVEMSPNRIALFGYAHLPNLRPHQKLVERGGALPGPVARAELFSMADRCLRDAGYVRIGLDHFAKPDDDLTRAAETGQLHRNFQGYAVRRADVLFGCGNTAITDTGHAFWQNHSDLNEWAKDVDAGRLPVARGLSLSRDDRIRQHVITRLMCDGKLEFADIDDRWELEFEDYFATELSALDTEEFAELLSVDLPGRRMEATGLGKDLIRNVCMEFDQYLTEPREGEEKRHSPTL